MTRLVVVMLVAAAGAPALAQPVEPDDPAHREAARARSLFERGAEALQRGEFASARELFQRSLALYPKPATAFNLGVALRGMGKGLDAIGVFEELLDGELGEIDAERRREVEELIREIRAGLARLTIGASGPSEITVRIDGVHAAELRDGATLERRLDAGRHVVTARAPQHETVERTVELDRGKSRTVSLHLDPVSVDGEEEDRGVAASPWLWTGIVVAVAAAVGVTVWALGNRTADPASNPVFGGTVETLRQSPALLRF